MDELDTLMKMDGFAWRVSVSILTFFGMLLSIVVWLFFYAGGFSIYQNLGIVLGLIFVFLGIMGATWAPWGMRNARKLHAMECPECAKKLKK